jgi:hypothetical protein
MAIRDEFRDVETRILTNVVQIDGAGPTGAAGDRNISAVGTDEKCLVAIAHREVESLADRMAVGVGGGDGDRVVADIAVGWRSGDDAGMRIAADISIRD